ncbi:putative E3 ubiquitin-protein ligase XBOS34 [Rosa sericea]
MGSSSSQRINIIQKLEVDNLFPLRFYFRMADIFLRQADVYREEKDIFYLYITLLRFASLVSETIPDHQDYIKADQRERSSQKEVKKKLLNALAELEELKPAVKQKINEINRGNAYQNSRHDHQTGESIPRRSDKKKVESVGTCSSSTGGENLSPHPTPEFPFGLRGNKRLKKETRTKILLEEAHDWKFTTPCKPIPQPHPAINQPTAPRVEEDLELVKAIDASIQSALQERPPLSDALRIHETNASSSSSTSMDSGDLSQCESVPGGDSDSHAEIHVFFLKKVRILLDTIKIIHEGIQHKFWSMSKPFKIHVTSTIQTSTTSDSIPSSPTPSAPPVSDDCLNDPFQCRSTDSSPIQEGENASSSCVICMDAPVEGAFIPCGHMAGCMACLNDIKDKNWDCPVCRAKVDQVIKLHAV